MLKKSLVFSSLLSLSFVVIVSALILNLSACQTWFGRQGAYTTDIIQKNQSSDQQIVMMTYNVENLFDTEDDPGKDDKAFLPLKLKQSAAHKLECEQIEVKKWRKECLEKDWSEDLLKLKLQRLSGAVLQVGTGRGPDLLFLQEVENKKVLERWNKEYLAAAGYQSVVLIEGLDSRGIDVAFLSRLPVIGQPILHAIPFNYENSQEAQRQKDTRGILQTDFKLPDGSILTAFNVHLPNPMHPVKMRDQAFAFLQQLKSKLPKDRTVVVAGDMNTTQAEDSKISRFKNLSEEWLVSHRVGCQKCLGTHYYHPRKDWSFLDVMLFSKNLSAEGSSPWILDIPSIQIPQSYILQTENGIPQGLDSLADKLGVSDHLPLAALLRLRAQPKVSP